MAWSEKFQGPFVQKWKLNKRKPKLVIWNQFYKHSTNIFMILHKNESGLMKSYFHEKQVYEDFINLHIDDS